MYVSNASLPHFNKEIPHLNAEPSVDSDTRAEFNNRGIFSFWYLYWLSIYGNDIKFPFQLNLTG